MKNLITTIGSVVIILALLMQVAANQRTYTKMICIDQLVNNFKEVAKEEGRVTSDNKEDLIRKITNSTGISRSKIKVTGTSALKQRGEQIDYSVKIKLDHLFAAPRFWGISNSENQGDYIIEQSTTSEYLAGM